MGLRINGEDIPATHFAYDGCHKIYLIFTDADRREMEGCGYDASSIYPVSELPTVWEQTCFLRFINSADLRQTFVEQGDDEPVIEYVA